MNISNDLTLSNMFFSTKPLKILIGPQTSLGEWPKHTNLRNKTYG